MPHELYTIAPRPGADFHVGRTGEGRQVILGVLFSEIVAYIFDAEGRWLSRERRSWGLRSPTADIISFQQSQDPRIRMDIEKQISDWKRQFGVGTGPIAVKKFFDDELFVGVKSLPSCLEQAAEGETQSEYRERCAERKVWIASRKFVLWWARDYWLFKGGVGPDWQGSSGNPLRFPARQNSSEPSQAARVKLD